MWLGRYPATPNIPVRQDGSRQVILPNGYLADGSYSLSSKQPTCTPLTCHLPLTTTVMPLVKCDSVDIVGTSTHIYVKNRVGPI